MYQFAASEQPSTAKLPTFFQRFQTKQQVLRVNKSKLLVKTISMEIILQVMGTMIQINNGKTLSWVFWQICDPWFNCQTAKYIYLRFSNIVWFLQFLRHLLLVLKGSSKLTAFCTKFCVKQKFFWRLDLLVCCCAANKYSEIARIPLEISKRRVDSKG